MKGKRFNEFSQILGYRKVYWEDSATSVHLCLIITTIFQIQNFDCLETTSLYIKAEQSGDRSLTYAAEERL